MQFIKHTFPKMIISDEGKQIKAKSDIYYVDENGEEHFPHYSTIIFVPNTFDESQLYELYIEEDITGGEN